MKQNYLYYSKQCNECIIMPMVNTNVLSLQDQVKIDEIVNQALFKVDMTYPEYSLEDIIKSFSSNIQVVEVDFDKDSDNILGAVAYPDDKKVTPRIMINKDLSPERKTFTLAHEFGHFLMHKGRDKFRLDFVDFDGSPDAQEETEANYFAATLLMPKEKFTKMYTLLNTEGLVAEYFGVSIAAVRNRKSWLDRN